MPSPARRSQKIEPRAAKTPMQARGHERVERILAAAEREILRLGVEGLSMQAVATLSGTATGSLYQFFPSKPILVNALHERYLRELDEIGQAIDARLKVSPPETFEEIVDAFLDPFQAFYDACPAYAEVQHALNRPGAPNAGEEVLDSHLVARIADALRPLAPPTARRHVNVIGKTLLDAGQALLASTTGKDASLSSPLRKEMRTMFIAYLYARLGGLR